MRGESHGKTSTSPAQFIKIGGVIPHMGEAVEHT